jgi:xylulokinase
MEGVGLGLLDGLLAVESTGISTSEITVIGGGSRSAYWVQMLADILGKKLVVREGSEVGPALGAARLARLSVDVEVPIVEVCPMPQVKAVYEPNLEKHRHFKEFRHPLFRQTYVQLRPTYASE